MSATHFICTACGTQFPESAAPPPACPICNDERQYVPPAGQGWTDLEKLRKGHRNSFLKKEEGLYGIGTVPDFAIGQRALLLRTPAGNVLWPEGERETGWKDKIFANVARNGRICIL